MSCLFRRQQFEIGVPTPIPSIQLGLQTAITPLKSPPPGFRSMFDFALAGPLLGFGVSLGFLLKGLELTAAMDMGQTASLPGLPVFMLQSSALGGGLIEMFFGNGVLGQGVSPESTLPMHPFAISGFLGIIGNALALLPLGHTDGGRVALAMFGRRGAFIVKSFTALTLVAAGLFGGDQANILLAYVLFALIWQRELETPARNEVQELDFGRGAVGIAMAVAVGLALFPMS